MKFDSEVMSIYKGNLIQCLVDRAYKLCCNYVHFTEDLQFIRRYLVRNRFPLDFVGKRIGVCLNNIFDKSIKPITVPRKELFLSVPYLTKSMNFNIRKDLKSAINHFYPQINLNIIFNNSFTINNFFKFKDRIPSHMISDVIYYYKCPQCGADYCGETTRHFKTRISDHRGVSARTNRPLLDPKSTIYDHSLQHNHPIDSRLFKILAVSNPTDIHITESIFIHSIKPSLNRAESSTPLQILI